MRIPRYLKINEARPNLSHMVREVGHEVPSYVIGIRNTPKAILIDFKTAVRYLPPQYRAPEISKKTKKGGEIFFEEAQKWLAEQSAAEKKSKINQ